MKRHFFLKITMLLCLCFLTSCGAPAEKEPKPEASSKAAPEVELEETPEVQELTAEELQGYFEKVFEVSGNCLDTPEQLTLELAELKTLTADAVLPEDYEEQYRAWRIEQVEGLLKNLQNEYDQIIASAPLYDGIHEGVAYADCIDFEGDGVKELLLLSISPEITEGEIYADCSAELYNGLSGHAEKYDKETIGCPFLYYSNFDTKSISLVQNQGHIYVHTCSVEGKHTSDTYYGIENNRVVVADETFMAEAGCSSGGQEIPYEEYEAIHAKYTDVVSIVDNKSIVFVQDRGLLPELPSEAQLRISFLEVLNHGRVKYAKLIDFDGDGINDLVTVEATRVQDDYGPYEDIFFNIYRWAGSKVEKTTFENMRFGQWGEGGIYRKKSTGELFLYCNDCSDGDGSADITHQFGNIEGSETISTADFEQILDDYGFWEFTPEAAKEYQAALGKYEMIEEFELAYGDADNSAITNARKQICEVAARS